MKHWSHLPVFLMILLISRPAAADSPITSTGFHQHYTQEAVVAARSGRISTPVLNFLLGRAPTDQKAACVNALSWQKDPTGNAQIFVKALEGKYRKQGKAVDLRVDKARSRTWYLHYNKGVTLVEGGKTQEFDLSAQNFMRCMYLADNGDLYVCGQTALSRIAKEKGTWVMKSYTQAKMP